jgi:hypothetical protein
MTTAEIPIIKVEDDDDQPKRQQELLDLFAIISELKTPIGTYACGGVLPCFYPGTT